MPNFALQKNFNHKQKQTRERDNNMNNFTRKTNPSNDGPGAQRTDTPWVAGLIFKMALIMSIIFAAFSPGST